MEKRSRFPLLVSVLFVALTVNAFAASYGSRASGSWSGSTTWYIVRTGTASVTSGSTTVTGTGTLFSTEVAVGDTIVLHTSPKQVIGRVSSVTNNTSLILVSAASFTGSGAYGRYSTALPAPADTVTINAGDSVDVTGSATIKAISVKTAGILHINATVGFTVTGALALDGFWKGTGVLHMNAGGVIISGTGKSLDAGTFQLDKNNLTFDTTLASTNLDLTSASVSITQNTGLYNRGTILTSDIACSNTNSRWTNGTTGVVSVTGSFMSGNPTGIDLSASGNTVVYAGGAQTVTGTTYNNLVLAGSGSKTVSGVTVHGTLSMQGTATASAAPTYGTSGALEYKGSAQQTTGPEFLATMNKNVFINNASGVVLGAAKTLSGTLSFVSGNLFLSTFNLTLSGSVSGAAATQAIVTNSTGGLVRSIAGGGSVQFPISTDGTDYNPLGISLKLMDPTDNFNVRVSQGVTPAAPNNQCAVLRTWTITEGNAGGNNALLTFQWDASQEGTSFNRSAAGSWWHNGSNWAELSTKLVSGSGPYTLSDTGFISRGAFGSFIVGNDGALPITLSSFTAVENGNRTVILNWSTISEVDNYGFEVQRSTSPTGPYAVISPLIPGHGTTNVAHSYSYTDGSSVEGTVYYRLKQTDLDQSTRYSDPIMVNRKQGLSGMAAGFALRQNYPNPFNPATEIRFSVESAGPATLTVFNAIGQIVATLFDGAAVPGQEYVARLDGSRLASGVYYCRLTSGSKTDLRKMVLLK